MSVDVDNPNTGQSVYTVSVDVDNPNIGQSEYTVSVDVDNPKTGQGEYTVSVHVNNPNIGQSVYTVSVHVDNPNTGQSEYTVSSVIVCVVQVLAESLLQPVVHQLPCLCPHPPQEAGGPQDWFGCPAEDACCKAALC